MNIDAIRDKIDLRAIVGQYLALRKKGNSYWAKCPFHIENTESFHVLANNRVWKCFGCGATGSAFDFLMQIESLTFVDAVRHAARISGIQVEEDSKPLTPQQAQEERRSRQEARTLMVEAEHWKMIERPPRLMVYDHPASQPEILGAYRSACAADPGLRAWIRKDIRQARDITFALVDILAKKQAEELKGAVEW